MNKLKRKDGTVVTVIVLACALLFPVVYGSIVDSINIYNISKQMKYALNASTLSAVSRFDTSNTHATGKVYINTTIASSIAKTVYAQNMNFDTSTLKPLNNGKGIIGTPLFQCLVYNNYGSSKFPVAGTINPLITTSQIQIDVTKPTVFAIARVDYKSFLGKTYSIVMYSSSQVNMK